MKIKDSPDTTGSLQNLPFKHPETGEKVYWFSQWGKGIWVKKDLTSEQTFPIFVNDIQEALEFEVFDTEL
jgi:hypothetical protein